MLLVWKFYYLWLQFAGQTRFAAVITIHQSKGLVRVSYPVSEGFVEPYSQGYIYCKAILLVLCLIIGKLPRIHLFCLSEIKVMINSREKDSIIFSEMHHIAANFWTHHS